MVKERCQFNKKSRYQREIVVLKSSIFAERKYVFVLYTLNWTLYFSHMVLMSPQIENMEIHQETNHIDERLSLYSTFSNTLSGK